MVNKNYTYRLKYTHSSTRTVFGFLQVSPEPQGFIFIIELLAKLRLISDLSSSCGNSDGLIGLIYFLHGPSFYSEFQVFNRCCVGAFQKLKLSPMFATRKQFWCVWTRGAVGTPTFQPSSGWFEMKNLEVVLFLHGVMLPPRRRTVGGAFRSEILTRTLPSILCLCVPTARSASRQTIKLFSTWHLSRPRGQLKVSVQLKGFGASFLFLSVHGDRLRCGQGLWCPSSVQSRTGLSHGGPWIVPEHLKQLLSIGISKLGTSSVETTRNHDHFIDTTAPLSERWLEWAIKCQKMHREGSEGRTENVNLFYSWARCTLKLSHSVVGCGAARSQVSPDLPLFVYQSRFNKST